MGITLLLLLVSPLLPYSGGAFESAELHFVSRGVGVIDASGTFCNGLERGSRVIDWNNVAPETLLDAISCVGSTDTLLFATNDGGPVTVSVVSR